MFIFKLIAGPVIGALIGYCTNYIAVKMLFKPHHPVMLGNRRLPFTPGLIPKRKDELAGAIGSAISDVLLTKEDLAEAIPADAVKETITEGLWNQFAQTKESTSSIAQAVTEFIPEEKYEAMRDQLEDTVTEKAVESLQKMNIGDIIVEEGTRAIKEKVQGTMLSMLVNDQMIQSIAGPIGEEIESFIENHAEEKIRPVVAGELTRLETGTVGAMACRLPLEKSHMGKAVDVLYENCVENSIETMMEKIDIAGIVEEKIKEMDIAKLEDLILSVMKKELNAIVNLGALIGFVIGILNLLISML